ncbi:MAG: hypothetical protein ABSE68_02005 [Minisyncoccia bacterium]
MAESLLQHFKDIGQIDESDHLKPIIVGLIKSSVSSELSFNVSSEQIEMILEKTPSVFPEDTKRINKNYGRLSFRQKKVYKHIAEKGGICPVPVIIGVIKAGLYVRNQWL